LGIYGGSVGGFMMSWKGKREIRSRYDAEADGYEELYSDEQRKKYELALGRLAAFDAEDRILDSGCGTGIFLDKVAGTVQFGVGVDLSSRALRKAQLRLGGVSNVDLVCADFDFLPFPGSTFEHIFMFTALPAPAYWGNTIKEALRVLTTHGIVILSVPKKETSGEKLLRKLRKSGLEPQELIDEQTTPDCLVIGKRAQGIVG
jgi:ubiquinone/menaquinone biosynthesis C-methylase UbiE